MRGKIGQDPMIIDVPYATSSDSGSSVSKDSDDSLGPETPSTDNDNRDRRYIWKPEPDIPIPQAYDRPEIMRHRSRNGAAGPSHQERGRRKAPRLDTDFARDKSTGGTLPQLERERSPYASGPHDRKPKPERVSGEYLLSPDVMSPRKAYVESPRHQSYFSRQGETPISGRPDQLREAPRQPARPLMDAHRSQSQYVPDPRQMQAHNRANDIPSTSTSRATTRPSLARRASELPYGDESKQSTRGPTLDLNTPRRTDRPTMDRRVSELPYPTTPPSAGGSQVQARDLRGVHDDSGSDYIKSQNNSGQSSPTVSRYPNTVSSKEERHHGSKFNSGPSATPPKPPVPTFDAGGQPINLSSLVSGAAIHQTLNAMLGGERAASRKASPRPSPLPSPRASPNSSPHSSPPRTPPLDSYQHRGNPVAGLKKDSPSSRPSSPLSSRSSVWTAEPESPLGVSEKIVKPRPGPLKSRKTAPLPSSEVEGSRGSDLLAAPGISVRSPSPAKHTKSFSAESGNPQHSRAGSRDEEVDQPRSATLRPGGSSGRQRSASSADIRPHLSVNPTPYQQASGPPVSPISKSKQASPTTSTPSDRYKPSKPDMEPIVTRSRSLRPEATSANNRTRSRSRSHVPEPRPSLMTQSSSHERQRPVPRSRSTMPVPVNDSKSSASQEPVQKLVPIPSTNLPICPRPKSVTGHNDWFTLHENTAFAICPSCRDGVFGSQYSHFLRPRHESSRKILCDLNSPWIRLALVLRGPDVKMLSALSDVTYEERSCPGDETALREWYRLQDPESSKHIPGFNACPHCVRSLEVLLPAWRDVFYVTRSSHSENLKERFCGLRASPSRFGDYLNMMVEAAQEADSRRKEPDTTPMRHLAKQLANIENCPRDAMFARKAWHIHPLLPEFTVCQDCYESIVYPLAKQNLPIASKIDKKPHQFPNPEAQVCCHLYSERMRKVFAEACEDNDFEHLRHTVLKRHMLQQDILGTFRELNDNPKDREIDDRLRDLLARWKEKE